MNSVEILDGAMGSEFIRRGISLSKHIWSAQLNIDAQEIVYQIHKEYVDAGANYLTTNTFRSTPRSYIKTGLSVIDATNIAKSSLKNAVSLANEASKDKCKILGSIAPLEDCYKPELFPSIDDAKKEFRQLGQWFNDKHIDIYLIETMNSIIETKTCLEQISNFNKPIWVSFVLKDSNHLLSGEELKDAILMLDAFKVDCLLINCSPIDRTNDSLNHVSTLWNKKWGIYPNLGIGEPSPDGIITQTQPDQLYLNVVKNAIDLGASFIGGCCGSTPRHINLLRNI